MGPGSSVGLADPAFAAEYARVSRRIWRLDSTPVGGSDPRPWARHLTWARARLLGYRRSRARRTAKGRVGAMMAAATRSVPCRMVAGSNGDRSGWQTLPGRGALVVSR